MEAHRALLGHRGQHLLEPSAVNPMAAAMRRLTSRALAQPLCEQGWEWGCLVVQVYLRQTVQAKQRGLKSW